MPFDGIVTKCVVEELKENIMGGRIEKVFQPEPDEIFINIRAKGQSLKLVLNANASYPRIHITDMVKENPPVPPVFCMLLRKHLSGGKVIGIDFHDYERIVAINIESANELGDLSTKKLYIEIMGRHSNIILVNSEGKIIDSIKHVDNEISSVREVMPARVYTFPPAQDKTSPESINTDELLNGAAIHGNISIEKYLLNNIKGFSPLLCREVCFLSGVDSGMPVSDISGSLAADVENALKNIISSIKNSKFEPCVIYEDNPDQNPLDFHCLNIQQYKSIQLMPSISVCLDLFYSKRDIAGSLRQKKADLLKVLGNSLERCGKKLALQQEKLREVADREKLKLYGELITANIYCIAPNSKKAVLLNYYSENGENIEIPLDENLLPQENAQKYFKQYSKAKSAFTYTSRQLEETQKELSYLESVMHILENCFTVQDIEEVRQELVEQGYLLIKKKNTGKRHEKLSAPLHFKSSDGLDIYVGKNNRQNDLLTLKTASSNDIWLHTRNIPGSHVIIKKQQSEIPDNTLFEAAMLAAYHSRAKMSSNVAVDYTTAKNVKKPNGAKPGMVIYENFKTIIVTPDEKTINMLKLSTY